MTLAIQTAALVNFYEGLSPKTLGRLPEFYHENARFIDPFNDVVGHPGIARIFADMFEKLESPRFVVTGRYAAMDLTPADEAMLRWELRFKSRLLGPGDQVIEGLTRLRFEDDGRVILHRDYWDPTQELYAKLPVLGWPVRGLARLLRAA